MRNNRDALILLAGFALFCTVSCFIFTPPRGPLKFDPPTLAAAQVGAAYETRVTISGNATPTGQFSISDGALPKGLALEKAEGQDAVRIFGTPQESGMFKFKLFVWCYGTNVSGQQGEMEYSLVVK